MQSEAESREGPVERAFPDLESTSASVFARDLRTGEVLAASSPEVPLLPASNAKLVTAARGFTELGTDYRFETRVYAVGERREEHLVGDLVVVGRGAPDLSQADLMTLAAEVADSGIETVAGELVVDASAFDRQALGPGWTWDDGQFAYGAKSTPLALERNTVDITITSQDGAVQVDASPTSEIVRFDVDVTVDEASAEPDLSVYKKRASEVIRVEGTVPPETTVVEASPVDDPMFHAASVFRDALESKGVSIDGWMRIDHEPIEPEHAPVATAESAPLYELVRGMLTDSDNFAAEQLARTVAFELEGSGGWAEWESHVVEFLADRGTEAVRLRDGSGLSRYNLLSASSLVAVLEWCLEQPWHEQFVDSLPRGGHEGTVENRLEDVPATVRAKTGTLTGARALSGYLLADGEPVVVFSCLRSNLTGEAETAATDRIDEFVGSLAVEAGFEA
ncbi:D-alanyl-D-alanine carboxypeptidase/D-alanyl-D-alanine endopeptidase [Natrononativus amylolyticus]|uniref:D-alanyl-D-alanine carboxypeptidase/D-alanyl-D-alanine endopeptidase n=1 Tax=Natrononativus amylolyticus TaxID=2963434 RepID=UPI0020CF3124|nr:D-alanyl-D-alanine carboxypeptidase/D-alanyl-D-alanine-endopeptidase [Natrononativus amylolyticus]